MAAIPGLKLDKQKGCLSDETIQYRNMVEIPGGAIVHFRNVVTGRPIPSCKVVVLSHDVARLMLNLGHDVY